MNTNSSMARPDGSSASATARQHGFQLPLLLKLFHSQSCGHKQLDMLSLLLGRSRPDGQLEVKVFSALLVRIVRDDTSQFVVATLPISPLAFLHRSLFMGPSRALEPSRHRLVLRQLATDSAKISSATSRGCPPSTPPQIVTRSCTPSLHALRQRGRACMRTHHC